MWNSLSVMTFSLLLASSLNAQTYQRSFYGEDKFNKPIVVPIAVMKLLKSNEYGQLCIKAGGTFKATHITLKSNGSPDVLVKADCIGNSADSISFWVFANGKGRYKLVLYTTGMSFEILKRKKNSHFNLWTGGCTASSCRNRIFGFSGRKYIQNREWWKDQI